MYKIFMNIDHIVVCKGKYNKFNKCRLILTIYYSHERKLDISNKVKKQDFSKLKKINYWVNREMHTKNF